jgi:hypothetical protein
MDKMQESHQTVRIVATEHGLLHQITKDYAIPNQTVSTVADILVTNYFWQYGVPAEMESDQGQNFETNLP